MMKIGIVGADAFAWKNVQNWKSKVRNAILDILHGLPIEILNNEVGGNYEIAKLWTEGRESEIIVISGHCPVGKERWYCVDCNDFDDNFDKPGFVWDNLRHRFVKIYDAGGVDSLVEVEACALNLKTEILKPEVKQWEDYVTDGNGCEIRGTVRDNMKGQVFRRKGYKSRNFEIVDSIPPKPNGVLYDIEPVLAEGSELTEGIFSGLCLKYSSWHGKPSFDLETTVKHSEQDAKRLGETESQSGRPLRLEKNKEGTWLIYDWGWRVRIDSVISWRVVNRSGGTWTLEQIWKAKKEGLQVVIG